MSSIELPPYVLQELPDITDAINYPIKNVQRIKYTCFDVSKSILAFGATSGGIYVFNRTPCEFVQLIPNKDGAITRLAISLNEKHIAFANGRGIVTVAECNQSFSIVNSSVTSKEHQGNEVTCMVWNSNNLFIGDDVGKVSVLQSQNFIAKTMFQSSSLTIMNLDSRICQLDVKDCMLLVSTLTRCYICDTAQEQYRQIGQKLRDGEYGACFVNRERNLNNTTENVKEFTEAKTYNIVNDEEKFAVSKGLENVLIYCARPSSRLWEANIDGTVRRTHQFKQVLSKKAMNIVRIDSYNSENYIIGELSNDGEGQSVNFTKIFYINSAIFSFKRDALYFLDIQDETNSVWYDSYKDIIDVKFYNDFLYVWRNNGSVACLQFMMIDKFLLKCYIDEKYVLCLKLCALFCDYLLKNRISPKLHILVGLKDKIQDTASLSRIERVIEKFESLKSLEASQTKPGIVILENTFKAQTSLDDNSENAKYIEENKFGVPPEALQTLKDISVSVSGKLSSSKKILKEKWGDFEEKMKHLNIEKQPVPHEVIIPRRISLDESAEQNVPIEFDNTDIIYKESSQKAIEIDNNSLEEDKSIKVCKSLYQYFRFSLVGRETEETNLISIVESYNCDINKIYELMLLLEQYCVSIGALEESKFIPNHIFLSYISASSEKHNHIERIIKDEILYKYFVDSCISVNMTTQKLANLGCKCGFPLPFLRTHKTPAFSELIDEFIERQWESQTKDQCYEICKKMPYLWRKILYLRRNEDLLNVLQILLQMLDENLLHSFLPQFTLDIWNKAIQLYATLYANKCLNCNKKFDHISVKEALSWDDIGGLMIKSIGGKNAIKIMEKNATLLLTGDLSMKFYHSCLLAAMYEQYDATIKNQLTDALYSSYEFENAREEICKLLRSTTNGQLKNTALPITVAAKTIHWGLKPLTEKRVLHTEEGDKEIDVIKNISTEEIINKLAELTYGVSDCALCGLPLQNEVLIKDGGLWVFKCGHTYHGACLDLNKVKLCPECTLKAR